MIVLERNDPTSARARNTAKWWATGPTSALYALATTGACVDGLRTEVDKACADTLAALHTATRPVAEPSEHYHAASLVAGAAFRYSEIVQLREFLVSLGAPQ